MRAHDGHVAPVVARRVLLLIAAIVLFIDDDEAEILHRSEDARPGSDHHAGLAVADAAPLLGALGIVKGGMKDRDPVAEAMEELAGHSRSQRDLGHQQQRVAAGRERRFDGAEIDLRLARAGDTVQQERMKGFGLRLLCGSPRTPLPDGDSA